MDLLIRDGRVLTPEGERQGDVAISGSTIMAVSPHIHEEADRVIDAAGMLVFPGFIDPHTHMELPVAGTVSSDDFYTGTVAAACGGVTTIIDFCSNVPGESFGHTVTTWKERAAKSIIDYGFHMIVPQLRPDQFSEIPDLVAEGISTMKCMMAYKRGPQGSDDANLLRVIHAAKKAGALPMVHAENGDAVDVETDRLLQEGLVQPRFHPISRPPMVEAEAVNRATMLAALADYCVYVVHLSSAQALEALRRAQSQGWEVYAETCPQYLVLDESVYEVADFGAARYVCSPPLRSRDNQEALWSGLRDNSLRLVASDHCPFMFQGQKEMGRDNFALIPNGLPTIEAMFPLLFTAGVMTGRLSLSRFTELSSTNSAKMFGLYPRKGSIRPGSDADLVLIDPDATVVLTHSRLHSRVDYTPFEGLRVSGVPAFTVARGEVIVENGEPTAEALRGRGNYLQRGPWTGDPLMA